MFVLASKQQADQPHSLEKGDFIVSCMHGTDIKLEPFSDRAKRSYIAGEVSKKKGKRKLQIQTGRIEGKAEQGSGLDMSSLFFRNPGLPGAIANRI